MRLKLLGLTVWATTLVSCGMPGKMLDKLKGKDEREQSARMGGMLDLLPDYRLGVANYESCAVLAQDVQARLVRQEELAAREAEIISIQNIFEDDDSVSSAKASASEVGSSGDDGSEDMAAPQSGSVDEESDEDIAGNDQEQGVREADDIVAGGLHLYLVRGSAVRVIDRASLKQIGQLAIPNSHSTRLIATADRLAVIGTLSAEKTECAPSLAEPGKPNIQSCQLVYKETTTISIYDASTKATPKLLKNHTFEGSYLDARLVGARLLVVGRRDLFDGVMAQSSTALPVVGETVGGVACTSIAKSPADDLDFGLTVVSTFAIDDVAAPVYTTGILGAGDRIYMTKDTLYVAKSGLVWDGLSDGRMSQIGEIKPLIAEWSARQESLVITKTHFDAATGAVAVAAFGKVDGRIKDQWAFKALKDDMLAVMTTTGQIWGSEDQQAQNHLWVLKQDGQVLSLASGVQNFGTNEDIRAVRYVGNIAYVVTFRETDPLFAFDLTDPLAPKLLGELFMPGFSTYLHPVEGGRMIGIGFNGGLQVSLYDVTDPTNLRQSDVHVVGNSWGSSSEAQYDHHAFYYDAKRLTFAVPFVDYSANWDASMPPSGEEDGVGDDFGTSDQVKPGQSQSGAIFYEVDGDKLVEVARISHKAFNQKCGGDVRRIMQLDGRLITISAGGIATHDPDDLSAAGKELPFADQDACDGGGMPIDAGIATDFEI